MGEGHSKRPVILARQDGYIAQPPLSSAVGAPLVRASRYARLWRGSQQVFTYSGPVGDDGTYAPDSDETGVYYIVLPNVERTSGEPLRLGGAIACGETTADASVTWATEALGGDETILEIPTPSGVSTDQLSEAGLAYNLYQLWHDSFVQGYDDACGEDWMLGALTTNNIRVDALSVWTMPDPDGLIDDDDVLVSMSAVAPRRSIRGYDAADPVASLGDLLVSLHATESTDPLGTEARARLCVLGFGHPTGVQTTETSYVNLRAGLDAAFKIRTANLRGDDDERYVYPVIVWSWSGAGVGNEAGVLITSRGTSDDVEIATTTNNGAAVLAVGERILVSPGDDEITVEFKAPTSGGVVIHTVTLWEDEP